MMLRRSKTKRGFRLVSFRDGNNKRCSLQESSWATEYGIWLGCDDPEPRVLVPGQGWQPIPLPEGDVVINTRMHLTRGHVQRLLPYLQRFVETGQLDLGDEADWNEDGEPKEVKS